MTDKRIKLTRQSGAMTHADRDREDVVADQRDHAADSCTAWTYSLSPARRRLGSGSRYAGWASREYSLRRRIGVTLLAGPVFLLVLPFLVAALGPRLDRRLGLRSPGGGRAGRIAGGTLLFVGFTLGFWSIVTQLDHGRGTPLPVMPTQVLLTQGPFRYCRNPMTLGTILAYGGIGIAVGTTAGLLLVLGFGAALVAYLKRFEEAELVERFGEAYLAYKREVPFIIPRLRHSAGMR